MKVLRLARARRGRPRWRWRRAATRRPTPAGRRPRRRPRRPSRRRGRATAAPPATTAPTAPPTTAAPDLADGARRPHVPVDGRRGLHARRRHADRADVRRRRTSAPAAGCNQLASTWTLEGDVLVVPPMAQTEMACEPAALMDQDTWLASVLTSRPTLPLDGDTLTIAADGRHRDARSTSEVADPDRPLEGTTGPSTRSSPATPRRRSRPASAPPTLTFDGGTVAVDTGCNTGSGSYTRQRRRRHVRPDRDDADGVRRPGGDGDRAAVLDRR